MNNTLIKSSLVVMLACVAISGVIDHFIDLTWLSASAILLGLLLVNAQIFGSDSGEPASWSQTDIELSEVKKQIVRAALIHGALIVLALVGGFYFFQ